MLLGTWVHRHLSETLVFILWGVYPEVGLLGPMVIVLLIFKGSAILFSIAAAPFLIPIPGAPGPGSSTSSPRVPCSVDYSSPGGCGAQRFSFAE